MLTVPGIDRHFAASWFDALDADDFSCGFASGYEVEGAGGDAIVAFFEAHPRIRLYYAPGPRVTQVDPRLVARINALRPVWHLNDAEVRACTGLSSLEEAGFALAEECGSAVVVTEGAKGAHLFESGISGDGEDAGVRRGDTPFDGGGGALSSPSGFSEPLAPAQRPSLPVAADGLAIVGGVSSYDGASPAGNDEPAARGRHLFVPTVPVDVVDTIGAGDAHLGALVAARNAGRTWEDALALANSVAGAVCQVSGGTLADAAFDRLEVSL